MNITDRILMQAIDRLPSPFDSHGVIWEVLRRNQREYVDDLSAIPGPTPILTHHSEIAMRIGRLPGIVPSRKVKSVNIYGERTLNQEWVKTP